jgi:thioredoxin-related protein
MKRLIWLMLLEMPLIIFAQASENNMTGVQWINNLTWNQIKQRAKSERKYIFIDVYATWCGPCKKMDKEVYTNTKVGYEVNKQFIAIKVQMDKTDHDNEQVKSWYSFADNLQKDYKIDGYPSFLFFNAEGVLVHKSVGWKDVPDFLELIDEALTEPETEYKSQVKKFKNHQLDFPAMPQLSKEAKMKKDDLLATEIAKYYKENYLDTLSTAQAFVKENLYLLADFCLALVKTTDRYFNLFYRNPDYVDSVINNGKQKISGNVVRIVIRREEIVDKIYKNRKPITNPKPNWTQIQKTIQTKYGKEYKDMFFPDEQIYFYSQISDWKNYIRYVNKKIRKFPPTKAGKRFGPQFGDEWHLNSYAWEVFQNCNDKRSLRQAIKWSSMVIDLVDDADIKSNYIDTKANLLYKMGNTKKAMEMEEIALSMATSKHHIDSYQKTIAKMKAGAPTWQINR